MYENYGGKRPEIPEGWEEVDYRDPGRDDSFINSCNGRVITHAGWPTGIGKRVIVRRKPDIDPALVPPAGYQFRLDEYGRPVCRAPKAGEWYLHPDTAVPVQGWTRWRWHEPCYILDPIPSPPKMTIVEAAKAAIGTGKGMRRRGWTNAECAIRDIRAVDINPIDAIADDWEVVP